ncbi:hypothetical protein GF339_19960 [candidate division KSB3 bacterium]|uniref:Uncharacterized protein n=1 Tax=candidate division KSB3 bacterium TaxID=2044937 RepID=A0A9D5JZG2_9BACT|nr:hypothetical protein [candidate division KSB3 bacterium]MBD3326870.1 hypothetical protein [candidate division KSB3 bacterium]
MKILGIIIAVGLCVAMLIGCSDDDNGANPTVTQSIANADPSAGFIANATTYRLVIEIDGDTASTFSLDPGVIVNLSLQEQTTHLLHVTVFDGTGDKLAEYLNSFYIDEIPLDNRLNDFLCSWYVEIISESGFANNFGT